MNLNAVYNRLCEIYLDSKVLGAVMKDECDPQSTRIVYGVLERDYELTYAIKSLTKTVKPRIAIVLKIGLYCLRYMDSMPDYAVVGETVQLVKSIGKRESAGFVNAVLRNYLRNGYPIPTDRVNSLSVELSLPPWLTEKLLKQYGDERVRDMFGIEYKPREHLRRNAHRISEVALQKKLRDFTRTEVGGYVLKRTPEVDRLIRDGALVYQAEGSMIIAGEVIRSHPERVLDVCAAPGGKSVYMSESAHVTAMDVSETRVGLIRRYAEFTGAKLDVRVNDGTVYNAEIGTFDAVLVDAPCSSIGLRFTRPDVIVNRRPEDIRSLSAIQYRILDVSSRYVREGGVLVYSTCTVLREENEDVVERFLSEHPEFTVDTGDGYERGCRAILPDGSNPEGFFVARFIRK